MIKITLDILGKGPRLRCLKLYVGFLFNLCEMPKIISCLGPDYTGHWCMTTSLEIFFSLLDQSSLSAPTGSDWTGATMLTK